MNQGFHAALLALEWIMGQRKSADLKDYSSNAVRALFKYLHEAAQMNGVMLRTAECLVRHAFWNDDPKILAPDLLQDLKSGAADKKTSWLSTNLPKFPFASETDHLWWVMEWFAAEPSEQDEQDERTRNPYYAWNTFYPSNPPIHSDPECLWKVVTGLFEKDPKRLRPVLVKGIERWESIRKNGSVRTLVEENDYNTIHP
ncbi:hypothetical protein HY213_04930 [Candidatus Peregrinibacteria bacterium]|nr:hypothetical protein [Candidatus Peregrinibacteria bacterium]